MFQSPFNERIWRKHQPKARLVIAPESLRGDLGRFTNHEFFHLRGVGRCRGVGRGLGVEVGVAVGVALGVGVGVAVDVGVGVAVGVGVGVGAFSQKAATVPSP
jgi:hypothetical protein